MQHLSQFCFLLSCPFIVYTIIMFSCTFLALFRIRTVRYRMGFLNNRRRSIDRHLITIMFVQIGSGILLTLFPCGFLVYQHIRLRKQILELLLKHF
jgi:hypothetical protein